MKKYINKQSSIINILEAKLEELAKEYESKLTAKYAQLQQDYDKLQLQRNEIQKLYESLSHNHELIKSEMTELQQKNDALKITLKHTKTDKDLNAKLRAIQDMHQLSKQVMDLQTNDDLVNKMKDSAKSSSMA